MSELRLQNTKDFGEIKDQLRNTEVIVEILKEETWKNQKDIRRIQKTMGIK
ncbi:hypothetical protein KHA94_23300 [Bacillus sp. FJAT-49705]|uniref:Uncharacterized protein n=1 Tax=Cytobacillus citreus TaxID=2833586 RepID=A0ABS5NYZ6_9BACI|nr:hypothetical protein [Cytobacillus citreus]MBS4192276.1 hypothetical protein [Cytobacillus citreus]MBS4193040.1 hypothetical protein [Cytobacillus citreus]